MICTRKATIKLRADLAALEATSFERLSLDELGELVEKIEMESQVLNRMRRLVDKAFFARLDGQFARPVPMRARRRAPRRRRA
jgi:hypothetical protein